MTKTRRTYSREFKLEALRPLDPHLATWTLLGMIHPYLYPADSDDAELSDEAINEMVTIYLEGVTMSEE